MLRRSLTLVVLLALPACSTALTDDPDPLRVAAAAAPLTGAVVDLEGRPLAGAQVVASGSRTEARPDGTFSFDAPDGPGLVQVTADGYLPRVEVYAPGRPLLSRLTPDDDAVSLVFGGDVMTGRRFYDRDEDGDPSDGLLREGSGVAAHRALLEDVRPHLERADLTVVNLESPLVPRPARPLTTVRDPRFHQGKEFAFASGPVLAAALRDVGVDVVDLGNNHLYDVLDLGVSSTVQALDAVGLPHFGAGADLDSAWAPARVERDGQRFSFLGCTTITGEETPPLYVAGPGKAGAAPCEEQRLRTAVETEVRTGATVVVSVHGGFEYARTQSENVLRLSRVAREAGALLVVDHHPHVVGGIEAGPDGLHADTIGNLLFDQEVWSTFPSYLLSADVSGGRLVRARTEPILLEDYTPAPVAGRLADVADRFAAGLRPGAGTSGPGGAEILPGGPVAERTAVVDLPPDDVRLLAPGWQAAAAEGLQVGQELLWTGSFEDADTAVGGGAHLWDLSSGAAGTDPSAARSGALGLVVRSPAAARLSTLVTTRNRIPLPDGRRPLTLAAWGRALGATAQEAVLELHWYPDTKGPSSSVLAVPVRAGDQWARWTVDADPPPGTVAVQAFLRLPAGAGTDRAVAIDDVSLVQWAREGTVPTALHGAVRATGGPVALSALAKVPAGAELVPGWLPEQPLLP